MHISIVNILQILNDRNYITNAVRYEVAYGFSIYTHIYFEPLLILKIKAKAMHISTTNIADRVNITMVIK